MEEGRKPKKKSKAKPVAVIEQCRSIGARIQNARVNMQMTPAAWRRLLRKKWITPDEYVRWPVHRRRPYLSQREAETILTRLSPDRFRVGNGNSVASHEQGRRISIEIVLLYSRLYGASAGKLLCDIDIKEKRFFQIDEINARKFITAHRAEIKAAVDNYMMEIDDTTIWRWCLPEKGQSLNRIHNIPLNTYLYMAAAVENFSLDKLFFDNF